MVTLPATQFGCHSTGRPHPVAFHTHQQRGDQCGATYQPQRDQKTEGEGKGANMTVLLVAAIHIVL